MMPWAVCSRSARCIRRALKAAAPQFVAAFLVCPTRARTSSLVALYLQTKPYSARAQRRYEYVGFVDDGRRNLAWLSGN